MPSDTDSGGNFGVTGRCYCGATTFSSAQGPSVVTYCHCQDCRRSTGAPVGAFAAFATKNVRFSPERGTPVSINPGVNRWYCQTCHSPLAATYDYLPGMIYIPLGTIDQADDLQPQLHSHDDRRLSWFHIDDHLPRQTGSARDALNAKSGSQG
ncbi:GFA family protein [Phaeobacter marinintestinus]|uniref:GFA family protein n=1 Tax=Falsiphaeobacter marinintestinus TaxID=1492905 RepID=UPI0011B84730|nr:GFA family protein [Phaeobacter marinintestinus]